jgi:hypothetical protein
VDVEEVLKKAAAAVEAADIPDELKVSAFEKAVDLYAGHTRASANVVEEMPTASPSADDPLGRICARLNLSLEVVGDVFFIDDQGEVGVGVASSAIDGRKAGGTKELALLRTGSRQLSGEEEWTSFDRIRALVTDYGRYDDSNFATTIQEMGDSFQIRGGRRSRQVRLKRPGIEALARLVSRLAGAENQGGDHA